MSGPPRHAPQRFDSFVRFIKRLRSLQGGEHPFGQLLVEFRPLQQRRQDAFGDFFGRESSRWQPLGPSQESIRRSPHHEREDQHSTPVYESDFLIRPQAFVEVGRQECGQCVAGLQSLLDDGLPFFRGSDIYVGDERIDPKDAQSLADLANQHPIGADMTSKQPEVSRFPRLGAFDPLSPVELGVQSQELIDRRTFQRCFDRDAGILG